MIILITGATHTGKTMLAQQLLTEYGYPYLSVDLLKMGLIRSGNTSLTPEDDVELEKYLWPILRGIIQTAVENNQHIIIEGGYIPLDWKSCFSIEYIKYIKFYCIVMSRKYIVENYDTIIQKENIIENRKFNNICTKEYLCSENNYYLDACIKNNCNYIFVDEYYDILSKIKSDISDGLSE